MKCRLLLFLVLLFVFSLPQNACANAGTPLMWAGMLHLVFGNALPESVLVYYISAKDGDVYSRHLSGKDEQKVFELRSQNLKDRLLVRASTPDTSRWDLVARIETEDYGNPCLVAVKTNMPVEAAADWHSTECDPPQYVGTGSSYGPVEALGTAVSSPWKFIAGCWAAEGLQASNKATGDKVRFSYETPFGAWNVRNAVHLPSDKALFQLGKDQICAFDPVHRRVALLWRGRGPVTVIENAEGGAESEEKKKGLPPATNQVPPASGFER